MTYTEIEAIKNKLKGYIQALEEELHQICDIEISPVGYYAGQRVILGRMIRNLKKMLSELEEEEE